MNVNRKWILDKTPEPFYTVAYFVLKIDLITSTLILYLITSKIFGISFSGVNLGWALVFGYIWFLDYFPYQLLKKKLKLVSHYLWYKPIVFLPIGSAAVYYLAEKAEAEPCYLMALFLSVSLGHFALSSVGAPHGISLYPFKKHFALRKSRLGGFPILKPEIVSQEEYCRIIAQAAENIRRLYGIEEPWERSWHQELDSRKSETGIWSVVLFAIAVCLVATGW